MTYVVLVTLLLLVQYLYFGMQAGSARGKADIKAPAMTGDENFERCLRVQMNTMEQLIITLPTMWICASFFRADVAAILGAVFLIGRFLYARAYIADPTTRTSGMVIGFLANIALLLCCFYAVAIRFMY